MIRLMEHEPGEYAGDLLACFVAEATEQAVAGPLKTLDKAVAAAVQAGDFTGKAKQTLLLYPAAVGAEGDGLRAKRVLLVGLGKIKDKPAAQREQLRSGAGIAVTAAAKLKAPEMLVMVPEGFDLADEVVAQCLSEGLILGNYRFDKYKTKDIKDNNGNNGEEKPQRVSDFFLHENGRNREQVLQGLERGRLAGEAACVARDMANEPGNVWTPEQFAAYGRKLATETVLECRVLEKSDLEDQGMGGILGVNQGSAQPPKLVILEYRSGEQHPTLMLVGKGLTFDSGGVSLKTAAGMQDMKYDMCGGAAVMAAMQVVASERPAGLNVVALVPTTENMGGSAAIKPGDIITHYNGKTSEVVNTDAEGRLILADALAYGVERFKPSAVVDIATLTGAVVVGLGHHHTGLLANNDQLSAQLLAAGELCGEPLWRLPLGAEYTKQLKSEVADLKNVGGPSAGAITAASYLQEFVGQTPWAHLDIAGTAWDFTEKSYIPKGPSGIAVRTLVQLIRDWQPLTE